MGLGVYSVDSCIYPQLPKPYTLNCTSGGYAEKLRGKAVQLPETAATGSEESKGQACEKYSNPKP